MITPSFALTATERVLPRLALDFTTATLDSRITFTRSGNTATVTNSSGVIAAINANLPRFDYDPTTLKCKGLLIEEARTNLLLNSLIDGTNLTTQTVATTAASTTLSFYGTGQIVLSGTSSATVVGLGVYPARKTLTFTPTAGSLTLTVTGTVQYAQLEVGAFATSFIPTTATSVTRNSDVATMTGANFSNWFNATEGTLKTTFTSSAVARLAVQMGENSNFNNRISLFSSASNYVVSDAGGANQVTLGTFTVSNTVFSTLMGSYKANNFSFCIDGSAVLTDTVGTVPAPSTLSIGFRNPGTPSQFLCGIIKSFYYYPIKLTDAEMQAFSKG